MVRRTSLARLEDILNSIRVVNAAVRSANLQKLLDDQFFKYGIERAIEIISEASRHISDEDIQRHPEIPWRNIKVIGNLIRHEYEHVDPAIIWEIATIHLGPLADAVEKIKATHSRG
jgi:uncharacterized protein with HEPN domain